jgi:hypothetical protein
MPVRALLVTLAAAMVASRALLGCWSAAVKHDDDLRRVSTALADALQRLPEEERRELLVRSAR